MTEYITKEQAKEQAKELIRNHILGCAMLPSPEYTLDDLFHDICWDLNHIPAADVAPVVHARWEGIWGDGYAEDEDGNPQIVYEVFECSNCGQEHHADGEPTWDYCPDCGARMDGEEG